MLVIFGYIVLALIGIFISKVVIAMGRAVIIAGNSAGIRIIGGFLIFIGWSGTILAPIYCGLKIIVTVIMILNEANTL